MKEREDLKSLFWPWRPSCYDNIVRTTFQNIGIIRYREMMDRMPPSHKKGSLKVCRAGRMGGQCCGQSSEQLTANTMLGFLTKFCAPNTVGAWAFLESLDLSLFICKIRGLI